MFIIIAFIWARTGSSVGHSGISTLGTSCIAFDDARKWNMNCSNIGDIVLLSECDLANLTNTKQKKSPKIFFSTAAILHIGAHCYASV